MTKSVTKLLQITDTHLFGDPTRSLRGTPTLPALHATLEAAADDLCGSEAILVTGDLVQDDPAGYGPFRDIFRDLGRPVLCVPGNHDLVPPMRKTLAEAPFRIGGTHDFGNWRVVMLDSSVPGEVAGHLAPAALAELDAALAAAPGQHALIALHHHPVPMRSAWIDVLGLTNADEFFAVLDRHPQVRAVIFGHVHQAFESTRGGVRLLGTPSTCSQFRPRVDNFAVDEQPPAWRTLRLYANGSIDTEVGWVAPRRVAGLEA